MKRKEFIKASGTVLFGGMVLPNKMVTFFASKPAVPAMGLQLFTFFNEIDNDVEGTLKKVAAVGYKEIESAFSKKGGYYGMKPKEFAKFLNDIWPQLEITSCIGSSF